MSKAIVNEILLNKMFEGKYLNSNIGHEVINFIKADNSKHYVYVNPYGDVKEKRNVWTICIKNNQINRVPKSN